MMDLPINNSRRRSARCGKLFLAFLALSLPSATLVTCQDKVIKKAPIQQTDASSGKAMYTSYCAACHGTDGKGDGPASSELKVTPVNLTLLAKNNHGEFPSEHVWAVLHFGTKARAHGTSDMPIWGDLLSALEPNDSIKQELRISNLVSYIKSIQAK